MKKERNYKKEYLILYQILGGTNKYRKMDSWEQEIAARNMERTLSIVFQLQNVNTFEKSITEEDSRIAKSGKEIKEKLSPELVTIGEVKKSLVDKMSDLVKSIGQLPAGSIDRSTIRGFENHINEVPKQYCHTQIYSDQAIVKGTADQMREYNQVAGDYVHRCVEEVKLKTVVDNLPDDKKVRLSAQLVEQLGF